MVSIESLVWFVFVAIIIVIIVALLWYAIGYAESQFPAPLVWKVVRVVFFLLCVFLAICLLMALIGHPLVRFG